MVFRSLHVWLKIFPSVPHKLAGGQVPMMYSCIWYRLKVERLTLIWFAFWLKVFRKRLHAPDIVVVIFTRSSPQLAKAISKSAIARPYPQNRPRWANGAFVLVGVPEQQLKPLLRAQMPPLNGRYVVLYSHLRMELEYACNGQPKYSVRQKAGGPRRLVQPWLR